ncbi:MAG: hypothetical protein V3U58_01630 [Thermodesulfobacteriota bacterium]
MEQLQSGLGAELAKFPPKLRKLALHIIDSDEFMTLKEYSEEAGVKYNTIRKEICNQKKKGNDFHELIQSYFTQKLHKHKPEILDALVREAKKGSIAHIRTVLQLTGDIKADGTAVQSTTNTQHNYIIMPPVDIPENGAKGAESDGAEHTSHPVMLDVPGEAVDVEVKEKQGKKS